MNRQLLSCAVPVETLERGNGRPAAAFTWQELGKPQAAGSPSSRPRRLFDLDGGSRFLELGLDRVGLVLGHALLDLLRSRVDEILRLFQAETGDRAHDLDHLDLLAPGRGEDDVERRLFLGLGSVATGARGTRRGNRHRSCGGDAPLVFDLLLQLEHGHLAELVEHLVGRASGHYCSSCSVSFSVSVSADSDCGSEPLVSSAASGSASAAGSSTGWAVRGSEPLACAPDVSPCASSCSMRASIRPYRSCNGAANRATIPVSGPMTAASTWLRSASSGGSFASDSISAASIGRPSSIPPRTTSRRVSRAASTRAFATATGSPSDSRNAIAVGPSSSARSVSDPAASAARLVSVFFTTAKRAPCSISLERSSSIWGMVSPR